MRPLADNGPCVLAEDGARLVFLRRRILPTWLAFVPALLALIGVGNGVVQLAAGTAAAGVVLVALGAAFGLAASAVVRRRRRTVAAPLDPADALVVLDLGAGVLQDGAGQVIAPLAVARVDRASQVTSSARALRVSWPGGEVVVYRGDALRLHGSIQPAVDALVARGIPVA